MLVRAGFPMEDSICEGAIEIAETASLEEAVTEATRRKTLCNLD